MNLHQPQAAQALRSNPIAPSAPNSEVADAIGLLGEKIAFLDNQIVQLHVRMEPVLRLAAPSGNNQASVAGSPITSPLTNAINSGADIIDRLNLQVSDLLARLAV